MLVECRLSRLVLRDTGDSQLLFLAEKDRLRAFPIVIGIFEAAEIGRKLRHEKTARPLTHDLVRQVVDALEGRIERVVVTEIKDDVFHARLDIEPQGGGDSRSVDCRPSDALALAVAVGAPVFVDETVLDTMCSAE